MATNRIPDSAYLHGHGIAQPETVYRGGTESIMSQDAQAIAYRYSANTLAIPYVHFNNAPLCNLTAPLTVTNFYQQGNSSDDLEIPWRMQSRQNILEVRVNIVSSLSSLPIKIRAQTKGLVGGASATNGRWSQRLNGGPAPQPVSMSIWRRTQNAHQFRSTMVTSTVIAPDTGTSDDFAIGLQAVFDSPTNPWDDLSAVWTYSATLFVSSILIRERHQRT